MRNELPVALLATTQPPSCQETPAHRLVAVVALALSLVNDQYLAQRRRRMGSRRLTVNVLCVKEEEIGLIALRFQIDSGSVGGPTTFSKLFY